MEKHPLELIANDWTSNSNKFFEGQKISENYFKLNYKFHFQDFKDWTTPKLELRDDSFEGMIGFQELFQSFLLPEKLPEIIIFTLGNNRKLKDFLSGNFLSLNGFVLSERAYEQIRKFKIGSHKTYKIEVIHKEITYNNYLFFAFKNDLSKLINFEKSSFYIQTGSYLDFDSRIEKNVKDKNEFDNLSEDERDEIKGKYIYIDKEFKSDLFTLNDFIEGETFISTELVEVLKEYSGLILEQTNRIY
jgi:hypothetical protein